MVPPSDYGVTRPRASTPAHRDALFQAATEMFGAPEVPPEYDDAFAILSAASEDTASVEGGLIQQGVEE